MALTDCKLIQLPKITDIRGNISFIEAGIHIPFDIRRVYYLYDVPGGEDRGAHAHRNLYQFIVPLAGSFDVKLSDGKKTERFQLNCPNFGLYICPMIWRDLGNFSSGSVCMVLASEHYDEKDYIRNYEEFNIFTSHGR